MGEDLGFYLGVIGKIRIEASGPGIHQRAQLGVGRVIAQLAVFGVVEHAHAQVLPHGGFALGFGETAHADEVVALDSREVILRLRIDHAVDRVGIGLSRDVRDTPLIPFDFRFADYFGRFPGSVNRNCSDEECRYCDGVCMLHFPLPTNRSQHMLASVWDQMPFY